MKKLKTHLSIGFKSNATKFLDLVGGILITGVHAGVHPFFILVEEQLLEDIELMGHVCSNAPSLKIWKRRMGKGEMKKEEGE